MEMFRSMFKDIHRGSESQILGPDVSRFDDKPTGTSEPDALTTMLAEAGKASEECPIRGGTWEDTAPAVPVAPEPKAVEAKSPKPKAKDWRDQFKAGKPLAFYHPKDYN